MTAAARLGLLLGLTFAPLVHFGPRPYAQVFVGAFVVLALLAAAVLTWRRTGLRLASTGMALAGLAMVLLMRIFIRWPDPLVAPPSALIAFGLVLLLAAAFMLAQSRTAPGLWDQWRRHQRTVSLADVLCFRHIPRLPGAGPSSPPNRA